MENFENVEKYIEKKAREILPSNRIVFEKMADDLFFAGGKHLRPKLDLAVVLELVQQASILQDDVFDNEENRRGKIAFHVKWSRYKGILMSDIILANAMTLLLELDRKDISKIILKTISKMCEGEIIHGETRGKILTENEYIDIIDRKTASFFRASCVSGAMLATNDENILGMISDFGSHYGIAYQLIDDCMDMDGTDLVNGTVTLPRIYDDSSCEKTLALASEYIAKANQTLSSIKERAGCKLPEEIDSIMEWTEELVSEKMGSIG